MRIDYDREYRIIAMVKTLTDAARRMGHGKWLSDPAVTFLRAELYVRDGLGFWSYADDAEAARRLTIWFDKVRVAV